MEIIITGHVLNGSDVKTGGQLLTAQAEAWCWQPRASDCHYVLSIPTRQ